MSVLFPWPLAQLTAAWVELYVNTLAPLPAGWWTAAWKTDYEGNAHVNLLKNIGTSMGGESYQNTAAIIQSSGYGKSRTVDEMATLVPTIPMNLRDIRESQQGTITALPSTDSNV